MSKKVKKVTAAAKKAAEELNTLLGLEPAIDTSADEAIVVAKIEEAADLLEEDDEVSAKTSAYLESIGVSLPSEEDEEEEEKPKKAKAKAKAKAKDEDEEEEEDEEDGDEEEHTEESLSAMNFLKMRKLAREMGANDTGKKAAVIAAILAVQEGGETKDEPAPKAEKKAAPKAEKKAAEKAEMPDYEEMSKKEVKAAAKAAGIVTKGADVDDLVEALEDLWEEEEKKAAEKAEKKANKPAGGMQGLANKLLKDGADKKAIRKAFTAAYAEKGKDDSDFIKKRIKIYMKIAKGAK